eukprot:s8346_g2.t1
MAVWTHSGGSLEYGGDFNWWMSFTAVASKIAGTSVLGVCLCATLLLVCGYLINRLSLWTIPSVSEFAHAFSYVRVNIYCLLLALSCSLEEFLWILDTVANVVGPCACLHSLHRQLAPLELRADCRRYVPSYFVAPLCISIGPLLLCAAVFVALIVVLAAGGDSSCGHLRCKWLQALLWWQRAIDYLNAGTAQKQLQRLAAVLFTMADASGVPEYELQDKKGPEDAKLPETAVLQLTSREVADPTRYGDALKCLQARPSLLKPGPSIAAKILRTLAVATIEGEITCLVSIRATDMESFFKQKL